VVVTVATDSAAKRGIEKERRRVRNFMGESVSSFRFHALREGGSRTRDVIEVS
jgi:hypothetical protein